MSQTLCKMEVFPAFDLPMMSTLKWIFGTRRGRGGPGDRTGDGAEVRDGGDGAGAGGDWEGAGAAARVGAGPGDRAGHDAGAGYGGRDGTRQQILCFAPMDESVVRRKAGQKCVDE